MPRSEGSKDEARSELPFWKPQTAEQLRAAAANLVNAVRAHAETLSAMTGTEDPSGLANANHHLLTAALEYAAAQGNYASDPGPFAVLYRLIDNDVEAEVQQDRAEQEPGVIRGVTVLQRTDYRVTSESGVMEAGRRAYLEVWPAHDYAAAVEDVTDLGRALYQLAHANGWESLRDVDGLQPTAGAVVVAEQPELLGANPSEWPEHLFEVEGEILYAQGDLWD